MLKRLYAKLDALCRARPRTVGYGMAAFATACFLLNPGVWRYPELTAWVAVAVLMPVPFEVWARARGSRGKSASK